MAWISCIMGSRGGKPKRILGALVEECEKGLRTRSLLGSHREVICVE